MLKNMAESFCNNGKILQIINDNVFHGDKKTLLISDINNSLNIYGKSNYLGGKNHLKYF